MKNNYYVRLVENALKNGARIEEMAEVLNNISEKARIEGAWPVWEQVEEAQMVLGL